MLAEILYKESLTKEEMIQLKEILNHIDFDKY